MTVSVNDEQRVIAFLDENLTPTKIRRAFERAQDAEPGTTFAPIANSPFEPTRIVTMGPLIEPYATTYSLMNIWESNAGKAHAASFKQEHGHELAISIDPSGGGGVALGIKIPEVPAKPLWKQLLRIA